MRGRCKHQLAQQGEASTWRQLLQPCWFKLWPSIMPIPCPYGKAFSPHHLPSHPDCPLGPAGTPSLPARSGGFRSPTELISQSRKQHPRETRLPHLLPCEGHQQYQNPPARFLQEKCRKFLCLQCSSLQQANSFAPFEAQLKCPRPLLWQTTS